MGGSMVWDYLTSMRKAEHIDEEDEMIMTGKVVVVTGANIGLGRATALQFAKRGATVIMACRNLRKAREGADYIKDRLADPKLVQMELDLGDFNSIRGFVDEMRVQYGRVNVLINNAGMSHSDGILRKTKEGFEEHFGINHLGHFLLTNLLRDMLKIGAPSRVVTVASSMFKMATISEKDLKSPEECKDLGFDNPYSNSKLMNVLFTKELAKRTVGAGITTYALCPGVVKTNIFRNASGFKNMINSLFVFPFAGYTPEQGCETIVYCGISKKLSNESGKMYRFCKRWDEATENLSDEFAEKLWATSEVLVGLKA